jgi:hypothetical protein
MWCGRRDSNPRTPTRVDLESTTVDHLVTPASGVNDTSIAVFIINLTVALLFKLCIRFINPLLRPKFDSQK